MRVLPQTLEIMFEVQRKKNKEKIARRKISFFNSQNVFFLFFFFFFFSLDPSYFQSF